VKNLEPMIGRSCACTSPAAGPIAERRVNMDERDFTQPVDSVRGMKRHLKSGAADGCITVVETVVPIRAPSEQQTGKPEE